MDEPVKDEVEDRNFYAEGFSSTFVVFFTVGLNLLTDPVFCLDFLFLLSYHIEIRIIVFNNIL